MKPEEREIKEALQALERGDVVATPTDTVYGLVADPFKKEAIEKIYQLKGRSPDKPLILFVSSLEEANKFAHFDERATKVANTFWPGPLTIVLKVRGSVPESVVTRKRTIAIRLPDSPYVSVLIKKLGKPLASTSANPSGFSAFILRREVKQKWGNRVTLIGMSSKGARPSTILDLSEKRAKILRKGPISILEIEKTIRETTILVPPIKFNVLFVCTGNTCRSPMAKFILDDLLTGDIKNRVFVESAGILPTKGSPMTDEARLVLEEIGIRPGPHSSKPIEKDLLERSDWILCMEERHIEEIETLGFGDKTELLGGEEFGEIPDPIGLGLTFYRQVREIIKASIKKRVLPLLKKRLED